MGLPNMDNTLVIASQAKEKNTPQANLNNSNELIKNMVTKKSNDKAAKGQRTHVIIHGSLNTKPQQEIEALNVSSGPTQDTPHLDDLRPPEHWDPNDDVAPDFLEANGTFVAETQCEKEHRSGTGGPR